MNKIKLHRISEYRACCAKHAVGWPSPHVAYSENGERVFQCVKCGELFDEPHSMDTDPR